MQNKANYIIEAHGSLIYKICGCQLGKTQSLKRNRDHWKWEQPLSAELLCGSHHPAADRPKIVEQQHMQWHMPWHNYNKVVFNTWKLLVQKTVGCLHHSLRTVLLTWWLDIIFYIIFFPVKHLELLRNTQLLAMDNSLWVLLKYAFPLGYHTYHTSQHCCTTFQLG